ncbi:MAG: hypothetical protein IPG92_13945 [Flavobacteriales bacterium]|nr:hypothetical protein [Flavobacteriales bacterium]
MLRLYTLNKRTNASSKMTNDQLDPWPNASHPFAALRIVALQVEVINPVQSACGYPTGIMEALISGGVPPYTVAWNTGATTEIITGLLPGSPV